MSWLGGLVAKGSGAVTGPPRRTGQCTRGCRKATFKRNSCMKVAFLQFS